MAEQAIISTMVSSPDWAWLPSNLLDSILGKVISITDYIRFGAVCKHWQSAASHQKEHRMKSCHKQLPMLMKIGKSGKNESRVAALFTVAQGGQLRRFNYGPDYITNELYYMMRWCGSTHGWLAYIDKFVLTLLNPFTGHTIALPPLIESTDAKAVFIDWVELSADPCLCPNDYEVLVLYNSLYYEFSVTSLAYFRSGDDTWTQIGDESFASKVGDAVYYKGQFVALTHWELPANDFTINFSSIPTTNPFESLDRSPEYMISEYILESSGGDLLLVKRIEAPKTSKNCIQVFKLLHADGEMPRWVAIKSIGSDVLFLSTRSPAMSVSALDFPQCVPNSIYFTDGVFNLEKTEDWIVKHNHAETLEDQRLHKTVLLWVSPTIR